MKDHEGIEQGFQTLRGVAIEAAQAASGDVWTDYNIHDPGVTLLEQTCFALSEASFRAQHSVPDLLTNHKGALDYDRLGFFLPGRTLPGNPVTMLDLSAELAESDAVARALLQPGQRDGLIDVLLIPAQARDGQTEEQMRDKAMTKMRSAFAQKRPLGCDLGGVRVAQRQIMRLEGIVEITATATPEKVAAEVYYRVAAILRGVPVGAEIAKEATRAIVYDQPQQYLHAPTDQDGKLPRLENHLSTLRSIAGVLDLSELDLVDVCRDLDADDSKEADTSERAVYRDLLLPVPMERMGLQLRVAGTPIMLDAGQILEEHIRISADAIARAKHHLDAQDWASPPPGKRRNYMSADVDVMLPATYQIAARRSRSGDAMKRYREMTNDHLARLNADMAGVPDLFLLGDESVPSDPSEQRRRVEILDYQIALQGEVMPATAHVGLHVYRSVVARHAFEVTWRLQFLTALPELNATRGTGPDGEKPGGFLTKFRLLADLDGGIFPHLPSQLDALKVRFSPDAQGPAADFALSNVQMPDDPYDLLVPWQPQDARLDDAQTLNTFPWMQDATVPTAWLTALAAQRSFFIDGMKGEDDASAEGEAWFAALFSTGDAENAFTLGEFETHAEATSFVNATRATWADIQKQAEGAVLIEDILLRETAMQFAPNLAYMVLPKWTARTAQEPYRAYVEALIGTLAPAHLFIRLIWLDFDQSRDFAEVYLPYQKGEAGAATGLRAFLQAHEAQNG
ncbi:MAG: hypothetical protein AB8B58_03250 [Roseobacter sp.]